MAVLSKNVALQLSSVAKSSSCHFHQSRISTSGATSAVCSARSELSESVNVRASMSTAAGTKPLPLFEAQRDKQL